MSKLGFTTVTFRNLSRREVCELAHKNNIEYLEWGGDVHLPPNDVDALNEVLSLQKEFNIKASSYGSYYWLGDKDYDLFEKIVNTASSIGAEYIRIWMGRKGSAEVTKEEYDSMVNETRILADIAKEKGLTIGFEFHRRTNNDNWKSSIEFLKAVDKENVKTYWQPFDYNKSIDLENLINVLPYVVTVHIFNWNFEGERYDLEAGYGKWKDYLNAVKVLNNEPNYIMEFVKDDSPEQFSKDLKALRAWL